MYHSCHPVVISIIVIFITLLVSVKAIVFVSHKPRVITFDDQAVVEMEVGSTSPEEDGEIVLDSMSQDEDGKTTVGSSPLDADGQTASAPLEQNEIATNQEASDQEVTENLVTMTLPGLGETLGEKFSQLDY
jgi:hypothetical protein